jgi:hypothetical protein
MSFEYEGARLFRVVGLCANPHNSIKTRLFSTCARCRSRHQRPTSLSITTLGQHVRQGPRPRLGVPLADGFSTTRPNLDGSGGLPGRTCSRRRVTVPHYVATCGKHYCLFLESDDTSQHLMQGLLLHTRTISSSGLGLNSHLI